MLSPPEVLGLSFASGISSPVSFALASYLRVVGPSLLGCLRASDHREIRRPDDLPMSSEGPAFIALWTTDHLNLLSMAYAGEDFYRLASSFVFLVDNSFGGLVVERTLARLRVPAISISQRNEAERLRTLRSLAMERRPIVIVVDGRGPYFRVGTGIANLARSMGASLWPCAARATKALLVPNHRVRVEIPRPGSRVTVTIGSAIEYRSSDSPGEIAEALENGLRSVRLA